MCAVYIYGAAVAGAVIGFITFAVLKISQSPQDERRRQH